MRFAINDPVALGAFLHLQDQGIPIPGRIALVGFSNNPNTTLVRPRLTTVNQMEELTSLFKEQGWMNSFPEGLIKNIGTDKGIWSVPVTTHRSNVVWYVPANLEKWTITAPDSWDDFFAIAPKLKEQGIVPLTLAHGVTANEGFMNDFASVMLLAGAIGIGMFLAILLDNKPRGEAFFRTVFLYPMSLSFIFSGTIWRWMLAPQGGINILPEYVGLKPFTFRWLSSTDAILQFNWQNLLQVAFYLIAAVPLII